MARTWSVQEWFTKMKNAEAASISCKHTTKNTKARAGERRKDKDTGSRSKDSSNAQDNFQ